MDRSPAIAAASTMRNYGQYVPEDLREAATIIAFLTDPPTVAAILLHLVVSRDLCKSG